MQTFKEITNDQNPEIYTNLKYLLGQKFLGQKEDMCR
jgi:hypothetical protein